jgi:hypothetical protein
MTTEEQRVRFINVTMDHLHNLCNELYEALIDEDFSSVEVVIGKMLEVMEDLNQTFQNEI